VVCGGIKINKNGIGIELLHSNEGEIGQDREDGIGVNLLCSSWTTFTAIASYFIFFFLNGCLSEFILLYNLYVVF
jgi:hypothetical protein